MNAATLTLKEQLINGLSNRSGLLGAIALWNTSGLSILTEGSDLLLILVVEDETPGQSISHYSKDGIRIQEQKLSKSLLENRVETREDRTIILWMMLGEIWMDTNMYLESFRNQVTDYPELVKEQKLLTEFSHFLKWYTQCKDLLQKDQILDAYSCILRAIHNWALIAIIEAGAVPELTVWQQVKAYNPGIYKLYEELTASSETLQQRVELVLLACEFSVMTKMEECSALLLRVLSESEEPLSINELMEHPLLAGPTSSHLPLILNKLSKKSLVKIVTTASEYDMFTLEVKYTSS